ncbi:hypothetical protein [Micromonospora narathiwatensis]|uniref:Uncharacterized protein n=1 Tax=Micromonospora narathiwatensis TaxID=299146 RepID=A0A1A8ZLK9_9ACTN|nr:hypothetical protein [Micromonospora narathiwatensis]SBT44970.1 hypothetical protein GA0070621_2208 [Micromonospora narathiwatensis]
MNGDVTRRLAEAVERLREHETIGGQVELLRRRVDEAERQLDRLRDAHEREQQDVERLEGRSITRVVALLRGTRDDDLARERAEAGLAARREADARAHLAGLRREHRAAQARHAELADAPAAYAALLDERERLLIAGRDPRAARLAALAAERDRLATRARQVDEAARAATAARTALVAVRDHLAKANGWSTYDTFFGGGIVGSMMKHSRMDDAAAAARVADRRLAVLRTELSDLPGGWLAPELEVGELTRFADIFLDNIFTDLAVRGRIRRAQDAVDRAGTAVARLRDRLATEAGELHRCRTAVAVERVGLLTAP